MKAHEKAHLAEGEILEVYLTDNPRALEARMILSEQPELNLNGMPCAPKSTGRCAVCDKPLSHGGAVFCGTPCQRAARVAPKEARDFRLKTWEQARQIEAQADRDARLRLLAQETLRLLGDGSAAKAEEAVQEAMGGLAGGEGRAAAPAWPGDSV